MVQTFLHAHSEFSLLAGVPSVPSLVTRAKNLGYQSLALTDVNRMSGLILFHEECLRQSIRPLLGVELREAKEPELCLSLLARNDEGYGDLCEIISQRQMHENGFSIAQVFEKPWPNLFLFSDSLKTLRLLSKGRSRERLYGSLTRHSQEARAKSREVEAFCDREAIPVVASGNSWFLEKKDHEIHRILRAIDLNSTLSRLRPGETEPEGAWMRAPSEMESLFDDRPEALALADTLAAQCHITPTPFSGKWIMPEIGVPSGHTPGTRLAELAREGLRKNYGGTPEFERAETIQEMELDVIQKLGYASYFLMVKEVYDKAGEIFSEEYRTPKDCSLLRGSAANSITFYNLGIGRLDPIQQNLYFQRFLNEDRASPPDADLDFGWDEREKMLEYVTQRFGRDHVAITCTFNHFKFKSAFREVAKVFGYAEEQVTEVLNSRDTKSRRREDDEIRLIETWAKKIKGKPHFLGQHPGGLLITNKPIWRHVACEWSGGTKNRLITQVDMHSGIDELGLIKFDLLGNGSLSVLRDTLKQIWDQGLPDPEVWKLEKCFEDPKTKDMISEGRTRGVFYIESPAQIRLNQKCEASTFDEVVVTSSLVRPAGTPYAKTYVDRHRYLKLGKQDWDFVHPSLIPILEATHDVCAFQEDVTKICHYVAGLSYKKADAVRKQMNSQHDGELPAAALLQLHREFVEGCQSNSGLTLEQAEELWARVASFTGFSFCKSHSASYAQLSFQCAWLKAHYPAEFLSSVISNNHGFYRRGVYLNEARRLGVSVLPLNINESRMKYFGQGNRMRAGFLHLRQLSQATVEALEFERKEEGPFRSLEDFLRRVPAGRKETENLILTGAFDSFGLTQPELLFHLDGIYGSMSSANPSLFSQESAQSPGQEHGKEYGKEYGKGYGLKSRASQSNQIHSYRPRDLHPGLKDYNLMQRCLTEKRLLGYMLSGNPLDVLELHPAHKDAVPAGDIYLHGGRRVKVFGLYVTERQHRVAKSGRLMQFLTLEDKSGNVDVVFWPDILERFEDELTEEGPFEVWGKVTEEWDTFTLEAERVRPVPFIPQLVDFELASARLRAGMEMTTYADTQVAKIA